MTKLVRWLVGVALTIVVTLLVAVPAWADGCRPEGPGGQSGHWGTTAAIVLSGLAVVLVVIVSWIALRKIAAARAARRAVAREAEEDRLRSGDEGQ